MGGMAAQIPIKNDPEANEAALARVREDKLREVRCGHDGTWVAHPGLVPLAKSVFDTHMPFPNQIDRCVQANVTACDLLRPASGSITEAGLDRNIDIGLQYLAAWMGGNGCVPIYNLMEDAATSEICRAQLWQWLRHGVELDSGRVVTPALVREMLKRNVDKLSSQYRNGRLSMAARLYDEMITGEEFPEFLTLRAYEYLD
jgi:malate synthase